MSEARLEILHIEDDPDDAVLVAGALRAVPDMAITLTRARTLGDGIAAIESAAPDIVLLDLELPDATGLEALEAVRRVEPALPVVVFSGSRDPALEERCRRSGAHDLLEKGSATTSLLVRALRAALERRQLLDDLERRRSELEASELRFRRLITATSDGMVIYNRSGIVLFMNAAAEALLGTRLVDSQGRPFPHTVPIGETREITVDLPGHAEQRILDMRVVATEWEGEPVRLACLRDITDLKRSEETLRAYNARLQELANIDPLTGLLNRRALEAQLYRATQQARRSGGKIAAALIDCDDFKSINDRLGHAVGDIVLAQFAKKLAAAIRPTDVVARIGGDEFVLLLPETRVAEAIQIADRARLAVTESPIVIAAQPLRVTASIGVASIPGDIASIEELLAATHAALAASKRHGKNRVTLAGSHDSTTATHRAQSELLSANPAITSLSQPIFDLCLQDQVGHEFLSRGPSGPFELPNDFFRLAYEQRHLTSLDLWCLKATLACAGRAAFEGRIHVNVFPSTLVDTPPDRLVELFDGARTPGGFCIEISEQQLIGDPSQLSESVRRFRAAGLRIAIDDVGFGRSSLESLVVLEPDVVKIDRNYVAGIADDAMKARWLKRLLRVVEHLGAESVAEGIESPRDLQRLKELGVPYGQGYLLGRPTPVDHIATGPMN